MCVLHERILAKSTKMYSTANSKVHYSSQSCKFNYNGYTKSVVTNNNAAKVDYRNMMQGIIIHTWCMKNRCMFLRCFTSVSSSL